MLNRKETKFDKDLRKAVGLNPGLKVRDYYGFHATGDMYISHIKPLQTFFDLGVGDYVMLVSFHWKSQKHKARARKATQKTFRKLHSLGRK